MLVKFVEEIIQIGDLFSKLCLILQVHSSLFISVVSLWDQSFTSQVYFVCKY